MRGPQLEDGYTRIVNEILEVISKIKLNGTQFKILMTIWRYTYGFNRKSSEFSLNFLSEATNSNKQQVKRELDRLIENKIIIIEKEADFNTSRILSFNKKYTEWEVEGIKNTVSELADSRVSELDYSTVSEKAYTTVSELEYQERKDITTTISIEQSEEEKKLEGNLLENNSIKINPVADMDAVSIQQDEKRTKDLQRIEDYYKRDIRGKVTCSGNDLINITYTYEKYKDADFIISVMEKAKQDYINRYGKLEINSFSYFESIFEERWKVLHAKKEDIKIKPVINKSYSGNKVQYRKNRFHNFEQRSDKYTAEELEDIARRKREQYQEKLRKQNEAL